jgi:3-oxoacyl-(acyl-carrier-protein) synthase/acyl carrier protein/GNAT superfamily N-acetyltransferase
LQPIAIIGASCRFPGATGLHEFWQLLREGRSAVGTVPKDRWDPDALFDADPSAAGKITSKFGGFITGIKEFDCAFFGISPREAASMDPQQRLLLETAYEAFEDAGLPMDRLAGSDTAVYVGIGPGDYGRMCVERWDEIGAHYATGNFLSIAADRIPYFFDLRGPSLAVDTACSSSLVAVHLACRSLEYGEATLALAGGVNALLSPPLSISLGKAGALSPTGRCRAFDAAADGYVRGEGSGFVVLKRLDEAIADRDRIYAVLRGSAVNQSGRRNGLTAPGSWGEENVMLSAWRSSGIAPAEADYVEAHGTGTVLGDAIEASALGKVFGSARNGSGPCRIGSVKTNFGHLETAAGIAGLLKVVLMISHGEFVPSLFPETPNPHVSLEKLGLTVQMQSEPWISSASPRLAGVSSFGLGGTYAHVCVTSPAPVSDDVNRQAPAPRLLVPISARHPEALRIMVREFSRLFDQADIDRAVAMCRAAARRRTHHEYRAAFAGESPAEIALSMDWWLQRSNPETSKASATRKLVVVTSETAEFDAEACAAAREFGVEVHGNSAVDALLAVLSHLGIHSHRVVRMRDSQLEDLRSFGDDFLDLTSDSLLAALAPLPKNGAVLPGFSSSETPRLTMLRLAGQLYQLGYPLAWQNIYPGTVPHLDMPSYPWQRQRCWWISDDSAGQAPQTKSAVLAATPVAAAAERGEALTKRLQSLLARVTGRPLSEITSDASPEALGIDSLMTMDLQEQLTREFGVTLPVEILVKAGAVADLGSMVVEALENKSGAESGGPTVVRPQQSRQAAEIREATLADYPQITSMCARNGLGTKTREEWEHLWTGNPVYRKSPNWPIGWVVENAPGEIVGCLGNIPVSYAFRGREIVGASIYSFALDASHRGHGLLLLERLLEWGRAVDYLLGTTANLSSAKLLEKNRIPRVPAGDWGNSSFWITNSKGFLESALTRKRWPKVLAYPAAAALKIREAFKPDSWIRQTNELNVCSSFDERFDVFWKELQGAYPSRFLTTRSSAMLQWHFQYALKQDQAWIVTREDNSRVLAYAVFSRCDNLDLGLKRVRLVDFQTIDDDSRTLIPMLAWGIRKCQKDGIHMLESFGFHPEKQRVIDGLAPHRRRLGSWSYFYAAQNDALRHELQDPAVWDPSLFDGDASL